MPPFLDSHDNWQILVALLWPHIQQGLKNASWCPWISTATQRANNWLSAAVAVATTLGAHITGNTTTGWTIVIPPLAILVHSAVMWCTNHVQYSVIYKTPAIQKEILAEMQQVNRKLTYSPCSEPPAKDLG